MPRAGVDRVIVVEMRENAVDDFGGKKRSDGLGVTRGGRGKSGRLILHVGETGEGRMRETGRIWNKRNERNSGSSDDSCVRGIFLVRSSTFLRRRLSSKLEDDGRRTKVKSGVPHGANSSGRLPEQPSRL